jgi:hypothetical protein
MKNSDAGRRAEEHRRSLQESDSAIFELLHSSLHEDIAALKLDITADRILEIFSPDHVGTPPSQNRVGEVKLRVLAIRRATRIKIKNTVRFAWGRWRVFQHSVVNQTAATVLIGSTLRHFWTRRSAFLFQLWASLSRKNDHPRNVCDTYFI